MLGVTKQSLNRVLRTLIDDGLVRSEKGRKDARERHLFLTEKGAELERALVRCAAGPDAGGLSCGGAAGGGRVPAGAGGNDGPRDAAAYNRLKEGGA